MRLPAWGLWRDGLLIASVRADGPESALALFVEHKLWQADDVVARVETTVRLR